MLFKGKRGNSTDGKVIITSFNLKNATENKDSKYDKELSKLEAQRTAIKTEQDGLKKVVNDNVNLSFKLFS